jgi:plastocyanin
VTSADKLGMIVAVSVVIIFVGIGVGMSGISEPVKVTQPVSDRPDVQQQAIPRDPSIPKEPPVISRDVQIEREVIPEARDATSEPIGRSIAPEGYEFEPKEASCDKMLSVPLDNLSISFDKASYQLNDVVQITVTAPSFNLSPYEIDCFGGYTMDGAWPDNWTKDEKSNLFLIGTVPPSVTSFSAKDLRFYKLIETDRDTGVFTGSFTISGLNSVANYGGDLGPDDGSVKHGDCLSNEPNENGSGFSYQLKYGTWKLYANVWKSGLWDDRISTSAEINCFIELDEYDSTTQTIVINVGSSVPGCEKSDTCFMPSKITINVGDSLAWVNYDSTVHTVTSGSAGEGPNGYFDSSLKKELELYILKFNSPGEFDYFSMINPWMTGTVIVK